MVSVKKTSKVSSWVPSWELTNMSSVQSTFESMIFRRTPVWWDMFVLLPWRVNLFPSAKHQTLVTLVGGFNPCEKYTSNWIISPNGDEKWNPDQKPPPKLVSLIGVNPSYPFIRTFIGVDTPEKHILPFSIPNGPTSESLSQSSSRTFTWRKRNRWTS